MKSWTRTSPAQIPRKKALLIGICYGRLQRGLKLHVRASHSDVDRMAALLRNYGYQDSDITIMKDDENTAPSSELWPSKDNIIKQMEQLVIGLKSGGKRFFMFSGHGYKGQKHFILPEDGFDKDGGHIDKHLINAEKLREIMVHPIRAVPDSTDLIFTFFFDCCHANGLLVPPMELSSIPNSQEDQPASQAPTQELQQSSQGSAKSRLMPKTTIADKMMDEDGAETDDDATLADSDPQDQIGNASPDGKMSKNHDGNLFPRTVDGRRSPRRDESPDMISGASDMESDAVGLDAIRSNMPSPRDHSPDPTVPSDEEVQSYVAFEDHFLLLTLMSMRPYGAETGDGVDELGPVNPDAPPGDHESFPSAPKDEASPQREGIKRKPSNNELDVRATKRIYTPSYDSQDSSDPYPDSDAAAEPPREDVLNNKGCPIITLMRPLRSSQNAMTGTTTGALGTAIVTCWSSESEKGTAYSNSSSLLTRAFAKSLEKSCGDDGRSTMTYRQLRSSVRTLLRDMFSKTEGSESIPPPEHQLTRLYHFDDRRVEL